MIFPGIIFILISFCSGTGPGASLLPRIRPMVMSDFFFSSSSFLDPFPHRISCLHLSFYLFDHQFLLSSGSSPTPLWSFLLLPLPAARITSFFASSTFYLHHLSCCIDILSGHAHSPISSPRSPDSRPLHFPFSICCCPSLISSTGLGSPHKEPPEAGTAPNPAPAPPSTPAPVATLPASSASRPRPPPTIKKGTIFQFDSVSTSLDCSDTHTLIFHFSAPEVAVKKRERGPDGRFVLDSADKVNSEVRFLTSL